MATALARHGKDCRRAAWTSWSCGFRDKTSFRKVFAAYTDATFVIGYDREHALVLTWASGVTGFVF